MEKVSPRAPPWLFSYGQKLKELQIMENSQIKDTKYFKNKLMCGVAGGIVIRSVLQLIV